MHATNPAGMICCESFGLKITLTSHDVLTKHDNFNEKSLGVYETNSIARAQIILITPFFKCVQNPYFNVSIQSYVSKMFQAIVQFYAPYIFMFPKCSK